MTPEQATTLARTAQLTEDQQHRIEMMERKQEVIRARVDEIHTAVVRQKGFLGGVLWVVSLLWAGLIAAWTYLKS